MDPNFEPKLGQTIALADANEVAAGEEAGRRDSSSQPPRDLWFPPSRDSHPRYCWPSQSKQLPENTTAKATHDDSESDGHSRTRTFFRWEKMFGLLWDFQNIWINYAINFTPLLKYAFFFFHYLYKMSQAHRKRS